MDSNTPRFRFKHLVAAAVDAGADPWRETRYSGNRRPEPPPMAIDAFDGTASLEELRSLLAARKLLPHDLVDFGRGLETIGETPELGEQAAKVREPWQPLSREFRAVGIAFSVGLGAMLLDRPLHLDGFGFLVVPLSMVVALLYLAVRSLIGRQKPRPSVSDRPFDPNHPDGPR